MAGASDESCDAAGDASSATFEGPFGIPHTALGCVRAPPRRRPGHGEKGDRPHGPGSLRQTRLWHIEKTSERTLRGTLARALEAKARLRRSPSPRFRWIRSELKIVGRAPAMGNAIVRQILIMSSGLA